MTPFKIIDIHTHAQLKPFNASDAERELKGLWGLFDKSPHCNCLGKQARKSVAAMEKQSQANFNKAIQGSVNGVFLALGPVERNFFRPEVRKWLLKVFLPESQHENLAACVTGFDFAKVEKIFTLIEDEQGINYYEKELVKEYEFVKNETQKPSAQGNKIVIASNYEEFVQSFGKEDTVTVVLTIEGAHALGNYENDSDFSCGMEDANAPDIRGRIEPFFEANIRAMKKWGDNGTHTPFFVTLCHHFSNLLAGHAKSFSSAQSFLKPGMDDLLNQIPGMNEGFSHMGINVVKQLLSRENGRRVLIDVKHMSVKTRIQFYNILKNEYWNKGDAVPIICSHAAANGYKTLSDSMQQPDGYAKWASGYLSKDSINISDEEAKLIAGSGGLIGIVLHGGRMPGGKAKKEIERAAEQSDAHLRAATLSLIMSNIFQMVRAINKKEAWDVICLGTDFDGVIEAFKVYRDFTNLPELVLHMQQFFHNPLDLPGVEMNKEDVTRYMFGLQPEQLVQKIIQGNVLDFLKRYFHDDYLKNGFVKKLPA